MASVTPCSNMCSVSFSFTSLIKSPGNTPSLTFPAVLAEFFTWQMFRCPPILPLAPSSSHSKKPAEFKNPFLSLCKIIPLCCCAVHREGCTSQESCHPPCEGKSDSKRHRRHHAPSPSVILPTPTELWHTGATDTFWVDFSLLLFKKKSLTFSLCIKKRLVNGAFLETATWSV